MRVREEKFDATEESLKVGEPGKGGEPGPLYSGPWRLLHRRANREGSGWKVVSPI